MSTDKLDHDNSCGEQSINQYIDQRVEEAVEEATEDLRDQLEAEREARREAEARADKLDTRVTKLREMVIERIDPAVAELQARELKKDAHIEADNIDTWEVGEYVDADLGTVEKDDGRTYHYLGEQAGNDPVEANEDARSRTVLDTADLLPVQQLASMDEETLEEHAGTDPDKWAARAWRDRRDDDLGLWSRGSKDVREYMDSSELASVIRVKTGVKKRIAQEYARRAFDALADLTHHRVKIQNKSRRKDGINYREKRLIIEADAEIPGEPRAAAGADAQLDAPATGDVAGD